MDDTATPLFDFEALLRPISEAQPCGDDTREDDAPEAPYFHLKDLRSQARALERTRQIDGETVDATQWRELMERIPDLLASRSKDLELVAWYVEALCRQHGFEGLAQGFELARSMLEHHWEQLHPLPDEEGMTTRMAPLVGLNGGDAEGTLIQPILEVPVLAHPESGWIAAWQLEQAAEMTRLDEQKAQQRIAAGVPSEEEVARAVRETPLSDLQALSEAIDRANTAFTALSEAMDRAMEGEPQPTSHIRSALKRCRSIFTHYAGERLERARASAASETSDDDDAPAPDGGAGQGNGQPVQDPVRIAIDSRARALEQLRELATFFRQTEPHSPVSYAIDQAVRWSELPLPELMQELIEDKSVRDCFARMTGVPLQDAGG
ncbi:MAG: type VI secretion system protein TssA [Halospina sp.]